MRAVLYLRVSTDEQATSGLGLAAQRHQCDSWAGREGRSIEGPYADDGVSGAAALEDRPGLLDAVAALAEGDVLLVAKRDRLGRDPIVVAMIERAAARKGCRVVSAAGEGTGDDDPSSVLMRRMVDAFAEYERLIIKARTKAALGAKRRRGERISRHIPYGQDLGPDLRSLVPNPDEIGVIELMRSLKKYRHEGGEAMSTRQIARELNARGIRSKTGGDWNHSSVRDILNRTA